MKSLGYIRLPIKTTSYLGTYTAEYCALSLEFLNLLQNFHLAVIEYLYRGRQAVPLQTLTTRHSNCKLFIVTLCQPILRNAPRKLLNLVK